MLKSHWILTVYFSHTFLLVSKSSTSSFIIHWKIKRTTFSNCQRKIFMEISSLKEGRRRSAYIYMYIYIKCVMLPWRKRKQWELWSVKYGSVYGGKKKKVHMMINLCLPKILYRLWPDSERISYSTQLIISSGGEITEAMFFCLFFFSSLVGFPWLSY